MTDQQNAKASANTEAHAASRTMTLEQMAQLMAGFTHIAKGKPLPADGLIQLIKWAMPLEIEKLFASLSTGHTPLFPLTSIATLPGFAEQAIFSESLRAVFAGAFDVNGYGEGLKISDAMAKYEAAHAAMRAKQAELAQFYEDSWKSAQVRFLKQLDEKLARGEIFAGMSDALQAWTTTLSDVAHELLPSPDTVTLLTETMHCVSRLRQAQNHLVEVVSEMLNIPTRAEVDEAYRLIHELRREIRTLKENA